METQGSVQVVVRLRPLNRREKRDGTLPVVTTNTERGQVTLIKGSGIKAAKHRFTFGNVYGSFCTQEEIYDSTLKPIITDVCNGIESTVFAYGQTGTGKTYTMEGVIDDAELRGLIPRASSGIFDFLSDSRFIEKTVSVSYLEIYNEDLSDLLTPADETAKKLSIVASGSGKEQKVYCRNLSRHKVSSVEEILKALKNAQEKRKTAETKMNKASSRSHCLFTLNVHSVESVDEGTIERNGKLHLVDLAGSECAKNIDQSRMRESSNINQSLLTLGRVITALKEKQPRVPYRDCKLTRILQEALGGRSKTCIIATLSPSILCAEETHSTLNFAERAHGLVNKTIKSDVKMTMQTPNTPKKEVSRTGNAAETSESFRDMEIRLKYMEAQCEEAQTALARKHLVAKNATERAETLEKEIRDVQRQLDSARLNLENARAREQQMKEQLERKCGELKEMGMNLVKSQSSERRLHAEATELQENLQQSTEYSNELHAQFSEHLGQQDAQKKASLEFMASVKDVAGRASEHSRKHQQAILSSSRGIVQLVEESVTQNEHSTTKLQSETSSQCDVVVDTSRRMAKTLKDTLSDLNALDCELRDKQKTSQEQIQQGSSTLQTTLCDKMKDLVDFVEQHEGRLRNWSDARKESLGAAISRLNKLSDSHNESLEKTASSVQDGVVNFMSELKKHIRSIEHVSQNANHQLYLSSRHEDTLVEFGKALSERLQSHAASMANQVGDIEAVLVLIHNINDGELKKHTQSMLARAAKFLAKEKKGFLDRLDELKQLSADMQAGNLGKILKDSMEKFEVQRSSNHNAQSDALAKLSADLAATKENLQTNCLEDKQVQRLSEFLSSHKGCTKDQSILLETHGEHLTALLTKHQGTKLREKEHLSSLADAGTYLASEVEAGVGLVESQRNSIDKTLAKHKEMQESMLAGVMSSLETVLQEQMTLIRDRVKADMAELSANAVEMQKQKRNLQSKLQSDLDKMKTETQNWGKLNAETASEIEEALVQNAGVQEAVQVGSQTTVCGIAEVKEIAECWGVNNRATMELIMKSKEFVASTEKAAQVNFEAEGEMCRTMQDTVATWTGNNDGAVESLDNSTDGLVKLQTSIVTFHKELDDDGEIVSKLLGTLTDKKAELMSSTSNLLESAKAHGDELSETAKEVDASHARALAQGSQMTTEIQAMQTALTEVTTECTTTMTTSEEFRRTHEAQAAECSSSLAKIRTSQNDSLKAEISSVEEMIQPQVDYLEHIGSKDRGISKSVDLYQSDLKQKADGALASYTHIQDQMKTKLSELEVASSKANKELVDTTMAVAALAKAHKKSSDELLSTLMGEHGPKVTQFASAAKESCNLQAEMVESCNTMTGKHCEEILKVNKETMQLGACRTFGHIKKISSPTKAVLPRTDSDEELLNAENMPPNVEGSCKKSRKSFAGTPNKKVGLTQRRNSDTKPSKLREAQKTSFLRPPSKLKQPGSKA